MSSPAIEVSGLSKRYVIEHESHQDSLRDTLHHKARKLWRRYRWGTGFETEEFWALRDVSFSVQPGEVVGIIGRNGAGKSTLLKILSRITEPTAGKVTLRGRVASLLEVGTGFHPDLTGRENIFLNGAILGMQRAEIRRKFDEIVAFAEIERFLDTPVKRYSSGMYVRLAFAVAAHLEPEILILDEVLAVGDAQFQKKCLNKMGDVASGGRTVVFVSHNMTAVSALCQRGVMLENGRVTVCDRIGPVVARYLASGLERQILARQEGRTILTHAEMEGLAISQDGAGWMISFTVDLGNSPRPSNIGIDFVIRYEETPIALGGSAYFNPIPIAPQANRVRCTVGPINLALGTYEIDLKVCEPMRRWIEEHDSMLKFSIERQLNSGEFFLDANRRLGFVIPTQTWSAEER